MSIKCIDVSTWQTNIDFAKVKASGISAVIIRAGYGRDASQKDNRFEEHYRGAKAAGLKIGAYWYSYAKSVADAALEAKACIACLKGKSFDLPIYFDMEEASQTSLGKSTLTQMAIKFCDTLISSGYRAGVYSNPNWFCNYLDYSLLRSKYSIWLAQWASGHSLSCDIWQYSSEGSVPGIGGNVDMNMIENEEIIVNSSGKLTEAVLMKFYTIGADYAAPAGQIKTIQRLLNWLGYRDKSGNALKVNGKFDAATEYAVKIYQGKHNLVADGIVGENTWKLLTAGK